MSRYSIFLHVLESRSFTKTAAELGYSQSAVSQAVKSLEEELGTGLLVRNREGVELTEDGKAYLPYLRSIVIAEQALHARRSELLNLENSVIRIGTFTSVSRNLLPVLIREFHISYPTVRFELIQGEYSSIYQGISAGNLDFGFMSERYAQDLACHTLYEDRMKAVLPLEHLCAKKKQVSLKQLCSDPFILLDEGGPSTVLDAFSACGLSPDVRYKVTDDYSILEMVRTGMGISMLYSLMLSGYSNDVAVIPIREEFHRTIAVACRSFDTLSFAASQFVQLIEEKTPALLRQMPL